MILDIGPVNVRGVIRAQYARILWAEGTLYVVTRNGSGFNVQTVQTSQPVAPDNPKGYWRAESDEGSVSFTQRGCPTCGGRYRPLSSLKREAIFSDSL